MLLGIHWFPGPASAYILPYKVFAPLAWDVCLLSVFSAASLTSWLACVHESLFIKLLYIVLLNKHIKETFRMSLAEQMNKNRWDI